ncbi:MAG: hypothetical protein ACRC62_29695 [Microcoleus sp.]
MVQERTLRCASPNATLDRWVSCFNPTYSGYLIHDPKLKNAIDLVLDLAFTHSPAVELIPRLIAQVG